MASTLTGSVVTENGIGVIINPGSSLGSYGDNEINGNGTDIQAFPGHVYAPSEKMKAASGEACCLAGKSA